MEISENHKVKVTEWIEEGASLSDVQRRLSEELNISMTYMDVRFMVLDLGLTPQDREESKQLEPSVIDESSAVQQDTIDEPAAAEDALSKGRVSVEIDRVMKPGALVSGSVVFSNGEKASWSLDQFGHLALDAGGADVKPSPDDLKAFQEKLRRNLEKRGF